MVWQQLHNDYYAMFHKLLFCRMQNALIFPAFIHLNMKTCWKVEKWKVKKKDKKQKDWPKWRENLNYYLV